jgi:fumarate reductase flavoprotein subunit
MLKLALCVAAGALRRTESRGAHYRADFPRRDDRQWLSRTLACWPPGDANAPELSAEPLDVRQMELPPGWRGYGARDYIEHPDSEPRSRRIDTLEAGLASDSPLARQDAVMPFLHLLPEPLRRPNNRRNGSA